MGSASNAPPPPDTSKYSDAAMADARMSSNWAKSMWETGQQEWGKLQQWGSQVMGSAMPAMEDMFGWAAEQKDFYDQKVVPAMESMFSDAALYSSKGEEQRQRAAAVQDVKSATQAQREAQERKLESYGVDASDLRYAALDKQAGVAEAAMSALAANQAGERTKQIGRDLTARAVGVGQNIAGQAMQATAMGANVGGAALNAATGATVGGAQVAQGAIPYLQGAYQGYDLGAGIVDTAYGRDLQRTEINNAAGQQNFNNMMAVGQSAGQLAAVADGGPVMAPGGPTDDAGAVAISDGEYVIPADVVRKLGTNHFDKMIEKETGRPPPSSKQAIPIPTDVDQPAQPMPTQQMGGIIQ